MNLRRLLSSLLLVCVLSFVLSPNLCYAMQVDDSSSGSALLYSASPRTIITGSNIGISLNLYDDKLMQNVASYTASRITLSDDETLEYFPYSKLAWSSSSNDYQNVDFSHLVYRWEITDLDKYNIMVSDFTLSMGNLSFAYRVLGSDYYAVRINDYDKVTYSLLRGTSYDQASWTSEIPLSKNSFSPGVGMGYYSDAEFKGSFSSASTVVGSSYIQTYGLRINFYFDKPSLVTDDSYVNGFFSGFGEVSEVGSSNYYGDNYFSLSVNTTGSSSNTQTEQLDNINTGISNVQNAIDDMKNKLIEMSNTIDAAMNELSSKVENQTQQINNMVTQQTQEIREQLGLTGDNITQSITNLQSQFTTGIQNVVDTSKQNTQQVIQAVENKVDEVKTGITEVKETIIDLPNKFKEMLTSFFVPDEEVINSKYEEFETLLSDRFGLIYQSADIIHDFADSLQSQAVMLADTGGIIQLASVTVNLAGTDYTFGGYDVDIIPDGFEFLQQAVRLATSMICTVVFINMCKSKLEAILR